MERSQGIALANRLGEPNEGLRPSMEFMQEMWDTYHVELGALVGRSALERPYGAQQLTIAEQFFREELGREALLTADLMEVNRTIMNVFITRALLAEDPVRDSYDVIVDCQTNPETRLRPETHAWLRAFTQDVLYDDTRQRAMESGLMRADLGKSKKIIEYMQTRHGQTYADHDRLLAELAENEVAVRRWNPTLRWLPPAEQELLLKLDRTGYHMPQDLQGESPVSKWLSAEPEAATPFEDLTPEEKRFGLLLGLLDIAGAQGDRVQNGSMTLTEPVVTAFRALVEAHLAPVPEGRTKQEAVLYKSNLYRRFRAEQLGIDIDQPGGPELTRLCLNLNYYRPEQAVFLQDVMMDHTHPQDRANLMELLSFTGFEPGGHAWVMYLPALIKRYSQKLMDKRIHPRVALDAALTLAAQTYQAAKEQMDLTPGVVIVAGDLVRALEEDPRIPLTHSIRIDQVSDTEAKAAFALAA